MHNYIPNKAYLCEYIYIYIFIFIYLYRIIIQRSNNRTRELSFGILVVLENIDILAGTYFDNK